jgi:WD40 repeat protein
VISFDIDLIDPFPLFSGRYLATAGWDKNLVVWETESGLPVRHLAASGGIFELEWHSSGSVIALGQSDRALVLVGVEDLEE